MAATDPGFVAALEQARIGEAEGGIPVRLKPAYCSSSLALRGLRMC
jgi:hypothetical protein